MGWAGCSFCDGTKRQWQHYPSSLLSLPKLWSSGQLQHCRRSVNPRWPALADVTAPCLQCKQSSHEACQKCVTPPKLPRNEETKNSKPQDWWIRNKFCISIILDFLVHWVVWFLNAQNSVTRAVPIPFLHTHRATSEPGQHLNSAGPNARATPRGKLWLFCGFIALGFEKKALKENVLISFLFFVLFCLASHHQKGKTEMSL